MKFTVGIDEVGRGPIAGPLVVCACAVLDGVDVLSHFPKHILKDSKKLSEIKRKEILKSILPLQETKKIYFGLGEVSAERIDTIGLSSSIKEAIESALRELYNQGIKKDVFVYLDGSLQAPAEYNQQTIIKGDEKIVQISLASIYAKEYRDGLMKQYSLVFPLYLFANHVGYGTKAHYDAIKRYGITKLHRITFLTKVLNKK